MASHLDEQEKNMSEEEIAVSESLSPRGRTDLAA
jgi:hypothetical protein